MIQSYLTTAPSAYSAALGPHCGPVLQDRSVHMEHGTVNTHAYAIFPEQAKRLVLFCPGLGHTVVTARKEIGEMVKNGSAVVTHETFGHGLVSSPFSYRDPLTRSAMAMTSAFHDLLNGGLSEFFKQFPDMKTLPIALLGHSMGAATILDELTRFSHNHSFEFNVKQGPEEAKRVDNIVLLCPRCDSGSKYPPLLRTVAAPVLQRLLGLTQGRIESIIRLRNSISSSIEPDSEEYRFLEAANETGTRPAHIPLPYAATVFNHDRRKQQSVLERDWSPQVPLLWAFFRDDREVDTAIAAQLALHIGGEQSMIMSADSHTPLRSDRVATVGAIHAFCDGTPHDRLRPLDLAQVKALLTKPA